MSKVKSKIYLSELVENKERRFGSATEYYPVYVEDENGVVHEALFTCHQLEEAMTRAEVNPEDVPAEYKGGLFSWLLG